MLWSWKSLVMWWAFFFFIYLELYVGEKFSWSIFLSNLEFPSSSNRIAVSPVSVFLMLRGEYSFPRFWFYCRMIQISPAQPAFGTRGRLHPDVTEYQKLAWLIQMCLSPGDDSLCGGQQRVLAKVVRWLSLRSKGTKTGGRCAWRLLTWVTGYQTLCLTKKKVNYCNTQFLYLRPQSGRLGTALPRSGNLQCRI